MWYYQPEKGYQQTGKRKTRRNWIELNVKYRVKKKGINLIIDEAQVDCNEHTDWLKDCKKQFENVNSMEKVEISQKMLKMQCKRCLTRKLLERMFCKDIG